MGRVGGAYRLTPCEVDAALPVSRKGGNLGHLFKYMSE